jgi:hypothetical protein
MLRDGALFDYKLHHLFKLGKRGLHLEKGGVADLACSSCFCCVPRLMRVSSGRCCWFSLSFGDDPCSIQDRVDEPDYDPVDDTVER